MIEPINVNIIDGSAIAAGLRADIAQRAQDLHNKTGRSPGLAVILVGDSPASHVYVQAKRKAAAECGMNTYIHVLAADAKETDVLRLTERLNTDPNVHGILVQLPLPPHINKDKIINAVAPEKDVDGLHPYNLGRLMLRQQTFVPCTPKGCLHLIKTVKSDLSGLKATVVGASPLVGRPMAQLLIQENCTVTQAHSKTADLVDACQDADILVVATGAAGLITANHVKDGAIIIDVGITRIDECRLVGDVDFKDVTLKRNCSITPVPGGVGPMTIAMLLENTLLAASAAK